MNMESSSKSHSRCMKLALLNDLQMLSINWQILDSGFFLNFRSTVNDGKSWKILITRRSNKCYSMGPLSSLSPSPLKFQSLNWEMVQMNFREFLSLISTFLDNFFMKKWQSSQPLPSKMLNKFSQNYYFNYATLVQSRTDGVRRSL